MIRRVCWAACALVALLPFLGGCAGHVPVSEMVLFHDRATEPSHDGTLGSGAAFSFSPARPIARALARREYPEAWNDGGDDLLWNPNQVSGGGYLVLFDEQGRYALSATAGLSLIGVDLTLKLWGRNYLTGAVSVPGQRQIYVQHRAFDSRHVGAALGLGYRREAYTFSLPTENALGHHEAQTADSFGARGFVLLRAEKSLFGGFQVGTYAGYVPALAQPVLIVTLATGRF